MLDGEQARAEPADDDAEGVGAIEDPGVPPVACPATAVAPADGPPVDEAPRAAGPPPEDPPAVALPAEDAPPAAAPYAAGGSESPTASDPCGPPWPVPATRIGFTGPAITDRAHVIPPTSTSPPSRMKNRRRQ